ncbi:hypothetical protein K440DRAFT_621092 [Wilcoxina mikolae CBS 423.85]|nr:hypothetical protein K440DRAFT_621092 [Wilcoxina mikolae CBS 423.85]
MCDLTTYYYCYRNCRWQERHAHKTSLGAGTMTPCSNAPHKEFKYEPGDCGLCKAEI